MSFANARPANKASSRGQPGAILPVGLGGHAVECGEIVNPVECSAVSTNSCRGRIQGIADRQRELIDRLVDFAVMARGESVAESDRQEPADVLGETANTYHEIVALGRLAYTLSRNVA